MLSFLLIFITLGELSLISMMVTYRGAIDMRSVLVVPLSAEREESKGDGAGIALKVQRYICARTSQSSKKCNLIL